MLSLQGKGMGSHSDDNLTNTILPEDQIPPGKVDYTDPRLNLQLPTKAMMFVFTYIMCGPLDSIRKDENNYKVTWHKRDSSEALAEVETAHNGFHGQFSCQVGAVLHGGKVIERALIPNMHRTTWTLRGFANPTVDLFAWLLREKLMGDCYNLAMALIGDKKKERVLSAFDFFENPHKQGRSAQPKKGEKTLEEDAAKKKKSARRVGLRRESDVEVLKHPDNSDTFRNCPEGHIPEKNKEALKRVVPRMKFPQNLIDLYFSWEFQQILLGYGIVLRFLVKQHNRKDRENQFMILQPIPTMLTKTDGHVVPRPDFIYPRAVMLEMGDLKWTPHKKPILSTACRTATVICLSSIYRIDRASGSKIISEKKGNVYVYGSGGAAVVSGQAGANVLGGFNPEFEPAATDSHQQQIDNAINAILTRMAENHQLVDLWMTKNLVMELAPGSVRSMADSEVYHVGLCTCEKEETMPAADDGSLAREYGLEQHEVASNPYLGYRMWSHKKITLKLVPDTFYKQLDQLRQEKKLQLFTVTDELSDKAFFEVPEVDGKRNVRREVVVGPKRNKNEETNRCRHMRYHVKEHFLPLKGQLPFLHELKTIQGNDSLLRDDSRPWRQHAEALRKENPFGPVLKFKKRVVTYDVVKLMQAMSYAAFARSLGKSLHAVATGKGTCQYSVPLECLKAAAILRWFSFPHPFRSCDPPVLLSLMLASAPVKEKRDNKRDLRQDLMAAMICHLFGRASGFGHFFNSVAEDKQQTCLRTDNIKLFTDHMKSTVKGSKGSLGRYIVKQYEKQIPAILRTSVVAATKFLEDFAKDSEVVAKDVLEEGKKRKQYVVDLAARMSRLVAGTSRSDFFFVAQHIVATLAEMYRDNRFGEVTLDDVYMGPGSRASVAILALLPKRPAKKTKKTKDESWYALSDYLTKEEANLILDWVKGLPDAELKVMGLYRDSKRIVRVKLTGRLVGYLDVEHMLCKLYLFLKKKSPTVMSSMDPVWHSFHCFPIRYNAEGLDPRTLQGADGSTFEQIALESVEAFEKLDFEMPWKFLLKNEWPNGTPWSTQRPKINRKYEYDDTMPGTGSETATTAPSTIPTIDDDDDEDDFQLETEGEGNSGNAYYDYEFEFDLTDLPDEDDNDEGDDGDEGDEGDEGDDECNEDEDD